MRDNTGGGRSAGCWNEKSTCRTELKAETGMMNADDLQIADVKVLAPKKHGDHRGFFSEVYNKWAFR